MPTSQHHLNTPSSSSAPQETSSTSSQAESPTYTPAATPCDTPPASHGSGRDHEVETDKPTRPMTMENTETPKVRETVEPTNTAETSSPPQEERQQTPPVTKKCSHKSCKLKNTKACKKAKQKKKKKIVEKSSESESSSSSSESSESESEDDESESEESSEDESTASEPEDEKPKRGRRRQKALIEKRKQQARQRAKAKKAVVPDSDSSSDDAESESESDGESEPERTKKLRKGKAIKKGRKKSKKAVEASSEENSSETEIDRVRSKLSKMKARLRVAERGGKGLKIVKKKGKKGKKSKKSGKKKKRASKLEFKRVDQLWDSSIHNYKLTDTAEDEDADEYDEYIFTIRRRFDWEDKYEYTLVDVKSKLLKEALGEVMDGVKGISLVEETPALDPNMLFMYLEEMRALMKKFKKNARKQKKKKAQKAMAAKAAQLKILVKYLDEDYAETKKTLYPMLEDGTCTFDLMWALFKPNTIAYTSTYGSTEEPRAFRIESAVKESSFMRGTWYLIEGKYLEFDGKTFGMGTMEVEINSFKGSRKITTLTAYPMKYHKDEAGIRKLLIERGRKFVALDGMHYRFHNSLAFYKKKKAVIKVNINGRIMVDPSLHRRINPNYPISTIKPEEPDIWSNSESEDSNCGCGEGSDEEDQNKEGNGDVSGEEEDGEEKQKEKYKWKRLEDSNGMQHYTQVPVDEDGNMVQPERMETMPELGKEKQRSFTDDDYLVASPVVLGFAFTEKLWLEFTVSGVHDIEWNVGAFDSLVLPENQKTIVKALVESHKFHGAKNIDDVIQGKGKGLVAVLHGPPGTGKTLTAEGIAELLRCPLYMVSAGELGTDPRTLEAELNKILDIAHAWGAVLLLDEADVFLEERTIQDIHRNALVSIFLRLLEYFQGILFLTTNRVETFDNAFQSRIHVALRYGELTTKAKKSVWQMFIQKVRDKEGVEIAEFKEQDFDDLSRRTLNGRQIKNAVRTAQALAVNVNEPLSMVHVKRVLEVAESFDHDLKGGTGYMDAMRSYT